MGRMAATAWLPRRVRLVAESAISNRDFRGFVRQFLVSTAWAATAVFRGLVAGFASIILPPAGTFGIVAVAAAILLWTLPDLPIVTDKAVRKLLLVTLITFLCVPGYYALIASGLPQISIRRISAAPLICLYLLYISTSAAARARLGTVTREARTIIIGAAGLQVMIFLSIATSIHPTGSLSQATDALLTWLIPFFCVVSTVKTDRELLTIFRVVCLCGVFVGAIGFADFVLQRTIMIDILPRPVFDNMMQDISFARYVNHPAFRNGAFRASSVFGVALSFGEFAAMLAPLGGFLLLSGRGFSDRLLGGAAIAASCLGVVAAGSRGGYIASFAGWAVFAALWISRVGMTRPRSLAPPIMTAIAAIFFGSLVG